MGIFLRLTLSSIFICFAAFIYLYPLLTKEYIDLHYKAFYGRFIKETSVEKHISGNLVISSGNFEINIASGLMGFIGICALFGFGKLFKFFGVIFVILGALLHLPFTKLEYQENDCEGEARKLLFLGSLLCGILAYEGCCKKD